MERPILFSAPMVRAILEGRKTQTRRVVKRQAGDRGYRMGPHGLEDWHGVRVRCPYGKPGDVLWVQEGFRVYAKSPFGGAAEVIYAADGEMHRRAIAETHYDKPSSRIRESYLSGRFMPRWASRLLLEVTDVRVERVQEIMPSEALAEGLQIKKGDHGDLYGGIHDWWLTPRDAFWNLWDSINTKRGYSWESNPWVWVVTFDRKDGE